MHLGKVVAGDATHHPDAADTGGDEVPLQHEIDPSGAITPNDHVKAVQGKRPKLPGIKTRPVNVLELFE